MAQYSIRKQVTFISMSLIWSILLYVCTIVVLDWNDFTQKINGDTNNPVVRVDKAEQNPSYSISVDTVGREIKTIPKSLITNALNNLIKVIIVFK